MARNAVKQMGKQREGTVHPNECEGRGRRGGGRGGGRLSRKGLVLEEKIGKEMRHMQ